MVHEVDDADPSLDDCARPPRDNHGSANFLRRRNALKGKVPGHVDAVCPEVSKSNNVSYVRDINEAPEEVDLIPEALRDSMDMDDPPGQTHLSNDTTSHLSSEAPENKAPTDDQELKNGPHISQWITLWRLRHDLRELYKGLMRVTHVNDFPQAGKVRRLYKNATHMLETGLSTFLEVLDGTVPTTLEKVLAFVAVSHIMWNAVRNENAGRGVVNHHDSLAGLSTWRLAIVDSEDQLILDHIAYELWDVPIPSAFSEDDTQTRSLIDSVDSGLGDLWAHPVSYSDIPESLNTNRSIPQTPLQTFQDDVSLLLSTTAVHTSLLFSDFLHVPGLEGNLRPEATTSTINGVSSSPQISNGGNPLTDSDAFTHPPSDSWGDFGYVPGLDGIINPECLRLGNPPIWDSSTQTLNMNSQSQGLMGLPPQGLGSTTTTDSATGVLQCLIGTILFQVVVIFLKIMSHAGSILQILSGCTSIEPSSTSEGLGGKNDPASSGSFLAEMREHAIEPLRLKFLEYHTHFIGLLESGYSLIKAGCIKSLQEFEKYLVHASLHFSNSKDFMFLVHSVLSQCLKCSSKMSWNDLYHDGLCADEYSTRYFDRRMGEEQATADAIFSDQGPTGASLSEVASNSASSRTSKSPLDSNMSSPSSKTDTADSVSTRQGKIERCSHQGCGKVYTGVDARVNLRRHVRCKHEPSKWRCPGSGCELATPRRDNLRKHFKTKHPDETMPPWLGNRKRC
ncbi:unnamed protein product [Clonostachys rhizophaga]|uniref:C2H2-type domain-containing protein n=1 Tax=Clonostachys rhizophaga TaxID=160324 RepID=A0A9N9VGA1_9HYPO|nr:unnamed protein product [Clonostachys rhizophaga]